MAESPIIYINRTDTRINVAVRQGTNGRDILHTALILLKIALGDAPGMEPVTDIDSAFEDIKAIYKDEYVDAAKQNDAFDIDRQKAAAQKAKETALAILNHAARDFIADVYGDVTQFFGAKIEEKVRRQKGDAVTLGNRIPSLTAQNCTIDV